MRRPIWAALVVIGIPAKRCHIEQKFVPYRDILGSCAWVGVRLVLRLAASLSYNRRIGTTLQGFNLTVKLWPNGGR